MGLIIRSSDIHAAGCYTTTRIPKGSRVAEYTGPRMPKDEADALYEDKPLTYLYGLGDGSIVIDGHCMAMFINHSCDPNCESGEEDGRVWIKAIKSIPAGAEITYDYCLYDGGDEPQLCNCGAKKCRGTMYSEEEIRRRKRQARAQGAAADPAARTARKPANRKPQASRSRADRATRARRA
jgi:SET domain-containing protein